MSTTIIISYQAGTANLLRVCLGALSRHTQMETSIVVATAEGDDGLNLLRNEFEFEVTVCDVNAQNANGVHGRILDKMIPDTISTTHVLTLDSDCFPIADGWLSELHGMMGDARIVGVLHPWAPPKNVIPEKKIEHRVRSQHNWNSTHVACQMMRVDDYRTLQQYGVAYAGGDDTGLLIPLTARTKLDWAITGWKPTRCPRAEASKAVVIPEYNRMYCVVYGDKMCHIGGYTRAMLGQSRPDGESFDWAVNRIMADGGAEFLLENRLSYKYAFDIEEEVAKYRLNQIFGVTPDGRSLLQS